MKITFRNLLAILLFGFAGLVLWVIFVATDFPKADFSPEKWKRSGDKKKNVTLYEDRGKMINDVFNKVQSSRMSRSSAITMLGKPDGASMTGLDYKYQYGSVALTYYFLRIRFSPKGEYVSSRLEVES